MNSSIEGFGLEALQTIQRIEKKGKERELEWFFAVLKNYYSYEYWKEQTPDVIVFGSDVPMEIVRALSKRTLYILGGSLEAAHWAEESTPRDMDHVNQSMLGWILNPDFNISDRALIIMTNASDSRKKMVSLLREREKKVIVLDVFPENDISTATCHYRNQLNKMIEEIEKHTKRELSKRRLMREVETVRQAKILWEQYRRMLENRNTSMSYEITIALMQSMYYVEDLKEWNWHMQRLLSEMRNGTGNYKKSRSNPQIMVTGSPILFPNLKITQLVEDAGMEIGSLVDSFSTPFEEVPRRGFKSENTERILNRLAAWQIKNDASGTMIKNVALLRKIRIELNEYPIEGILVHILKGQIEYDFELAAIEAIAEQWKIPVFRMETDYQYQDVEQLRIRMEAFSEMLRQRRQAKRRA